MLQRIIICIGLVAMAIASFAQPDPNNPGAVVNPRGDVRNNPPARDMMNYTYVNALAQNPPTAIEATADGIFIYRNGILALFANGNDTPLRSFELYEKMPAIPKIDAAVEEKRAYMNALALRVAPMVMIIDNKKVLLASDAQIFAIDLATFKLISKVPLPDQIADPAAGINVAIMNGRVMGNNFAPPTIKVADNLVYLLRGNIMTTIDIQAGKVLSNKPLPANMTPVPVPLNDWIRLMRDNPNEFPAPPPPDGGKPNPPPGTAANMVTLLGIVRHVANTEIWNIEVEGGVKYQLTGDKAQVLIKQANIDGTRIRASGTIAPVAGTDMKSFKIADFQLLR